MRGVFIESTGFTHWMTQTLGDESLAEVQQLLLSHPASGDVMPGCGGLRKLRVPDVRRGKGKRSGARIIYLHVPEAHCFFLLDGYGKDEQDDLSAGQKKLLRQLAEQLKEECRDRHSQRLRKHKP